MFLFTVAAVRVFFSTRLKVIYFVDYFHLSQRCFGKTFPRLRSKARAADVDEVTSAPKVFRHFGVSLWSTNYDILVFNEWDVDMTVKPTKREPHVRAGRASPLKAVRVSPNPGVRPACTTRMCGSVSRSQWPGSRRVQSTCVEILLRPSSLHDILFFAWLPCSIQYSRWRLQDCPIRHPAFIAWCFRCFRICLFLARKKLAGH